MGYLDRYAKKGRKGEKKRPVTVWLVEEDFEKWSKYCKKRGLSKSEAGAILFRREMYGDE